MLASQIIEKYEEFCPKELSISGDISGLQMGTLKKDIQRVMVALDVREQTVEEAVKKRIDLLIVKHAPIFHPLNNLVIDHTPNLILLNLIKHDISVYVSHTNIDVVPGGLNDWFCDLLGITNREVLSEVRDGNGIGRVGDIITQTFEDFAKTVKKAFKLDSLRLIRYRNQKKNSQTISRVAICGGSGGDFYKDALTKGADVYVTGDIYFHIAQEMLTNGLLAIDPGHYIEVLFIDKVVALLEEWKTKEEWEVDILSSQVSTDPFQIL